MVEYASSWPPTLYRLAPELGVHFCIELGRGRGFEAGRGVAEEHWGTKVMSQVGDGC